MGMDSMAMSSWRATYSMLARRGNGKAITVVSIEIATTVNGDRPPLNSHLPLSGNHGSLLRFSTQKLVELFGLRVTLLISLRGFYVLDLGLSY